MLASLRWACPNDVWPGAVKDRLIPLKIGTAMLALRVPMSAIPADIDVVLDRFVTITTEDIGDHRHHALPGLLAFTPKRSYGDSPPKGKNKRAPESIVGTLISIVREMIGAALDPVTSMPGASPL